MNEDRGSATVVALGLIPILVLATVAVAALGLAYVARATATNAADAAALAAAVATYPATGRGSPSEEARRMAQQNDAILISCDCGIDSRMRRRTVSVTTAVFVDLPLFGERVVRVASRAEFDPRRWLGR